MTNKEYLQSLSVEELVQTYYFTTCPYGEIYKKVQAEKGNIICKKDEQLATLKGSEQIADFVFSGKQKEICNACKLNWLNKEKE